MIDYIEYTQTLKEQVRQKKPLVHHITNFVTIYQCARITAFLGASPVMAFAANESADVTSKSNALVVNTGTLNDEVIRAIPRSLAYANAHDIPVVLDPVGINLSSYRHDFILDLLNNYHFSVIRCNAVELLNLYGKTLAGRGIDGEVSNLPEAKEAIMALANHYHCTLACTGKTDLICDGKTLLEFSRGSFLLPKLVGTGCMINSLIGSFLPIAPTALDAAVAGILTMCLAGEKAQHKLEQSGQALTNLGSFETYLMDYIY